MVKPRTENKGGDTGITPPPPRTTEGTPARPGSLLPDAKARDKSGETELPPTAGLGSTDYVPYQADLRRTGVSGGRLGLGASGETVYTALESFKTMKYTDPEGYNNLVNQMREAGIIGPRVTSDVSIAGAYETVLKASADLAQEGIFKEPDLLIQEVGEFNRSGGLNVTSGPGGIGAYTGPRTTVSMASERDLRNTADAVASTVLGRAVTDDEFQKVLEQVRSAEEAEPTVTRTTGGMTTSQAGLSAEGRQNIIREALMQGPEAEDFGKATKMMDLFYSALGARPGGA